MATRILGPTGSKKRRRFLLVPILLAACTALFVIGGAQATTYSGGVQDTGLFQLDGNTLPSTCGPPDDWAALYTQISDPTPCSADAFSFINDKTGSADTTYWQGGGSKDAYDPAAGPWLAGLNNVAPDKNDIVNAFAAIYHVNPSTDNLPFLFFGADRFATNGDAQMGFQFLQAASCIAVVPGATAGQEGYCTSATPNQAANAGKFVDPGSGLPINHRNGDLLILVNFNKGGTLGLAGVFEWGGATVANPAGGSYSVVVSSGTSSSNPPADCATVGDPNNFCATASTASEPGDPVWPYTAKDGTTSYSASSFMEGGVNLAAIPGAGTCFPSFLAETRSSAGPSSGLSLQAQLKDLAFGHFQLCAPSLTTQASTNSTVQPGTPVHDTATIAVSGASNPPDPTGTVTFHLCGNTSQTTYPTCDGTTGHVGTLVGTGDLNGGTNTTDGMASAVSPSVNCTSDTATATPGCYVGGSVNPLANGSYCFRADWPGDAHYPGPQSFTDGSNECFRVLQLGTTTVTSPQSPSGTNITGNVALGTSNIVDHAIVTGTAAGGPPPGSVNFYICTPSQVTIGTDGLAHCAGTGSTGDGGPVGGTSTGNPVSVTTVSGSTTQSEATSSPTVTANALGVWCFRADYVPTGTLYTGSSDNSNDECFTVTTTSSATSKQNWLPNDHIDISTATGASLTGTLDISLRSGSCSGTKVYQEPAPYDGSDSTVSVPIAGGIDTSNSTFKVDVSPDANAGTYYWRIVFVPNSSFATGFTKCETSTVTINDSP